MKIFRFFGMALAAVCMCVNFAACSKDDDSDGAGGTNGGDYTSEKKLAKIVSEPWTETFSYDDQGRLIEVVYVREEESSKQTDVYQYIWGDDAILVNMKSEVIFSDGYTSNYTRNFRYNIGNGRVQSSGDIKYNNSNRLSQWYTDEYTDEYFWDGDKLMAINEGDIKFTYKESCKKGYSPLFVEYIYSEDPLFMAHPEIIGCRTKQLPATITVTWNDGPGYGEQTEAISYSYKFDNEGYISKITMSDGPSNGPVVDICYLTWE